jgi:hypothetical protein
MRRMFERNCGGRVKSTPDMVPNATVWYTRLEDRRVTVIAILQHVRHGMLIRRDWGPSAPGRPVDSRGLINTALPIIVPLTGVAESRQCFYQAVFDYRYLVLLFIPQVPGDVMGAVVLEGNEIRHGLFDWLRQACEGAGVEPQLSRHQ